MRLEILDPPSIEPVTLAEFKRYARVWEDLTDDDDLIETLITAARETLERRLARAFLSQNLREFRTIPEDGRIRLLRTPVMDVIDVEIDGEPIDVPALEGPATLRLGHPGKAVEITYEAGYGDDSGDVPKTLRLAVLMLAAHFYDQRATSEEVPPLIAMLSAAFSWGGEGPPL